MGDDRAAEGAVNVDSLSAAPKGGWLGTSGGMSKDSGRQSLPNPELHDDGVYQFQLDGVDQQMYWDRAGQIKDDNYPNVPNVALPGNGTTNAGQQGAPVDWGSVAPDTYPEHQPSPKGANFPLLPRV